MINAIPQPAGVVTAAVWNISDVPPPDYCAERMARDGRLEAARIRGCSPKSGRSVLSRQLQFMEIGRPPRLSLPGRTLPLVSLLSDSLGRRRCNRFPTLRNSNGGRPTRCCQSDRGLSCGCGVPEQSHHFGKPFGWLRSDNSHTALQCDRRPKLCFTSTLNLCSAAKADSRSSATKPE